MESKIVIYETDKGGDTIEVHLDQEHNTVWLTQKMLADLFQTTKQNIGQHLKNIFDEAELQQDSVVKNFFTTAADGKKYGTNFYNLDAIISVGYRVNSKQGVRFRQWATKTLNEHLTMGYTINRQIHKGIRIALILDHHFNSPYNS